MVCSSFSTSSSTGGLLSFIFFYHSHPRVWYHSPSMRYFLCFWFAFPWLLNVVEHLLMCLLAIFVSSLKKGLFRSFAHFKIRLFVFLLMSLYIFWILSSDIWAIKKFIHPVCFHFLVVSFDAQKVLILMTSCFILRLLVPEISCVKITLLRPTSQRFTPMFFLKSFIVLTLRYLELWFILG